MADYPATVCGCDWPRAVREEPFLVVPYQAGALLRSCERANLIPRDAKVLRILVEAKGNVVTLSDLAIEAGMVGEWAFSDLYHCVARIRKHFENSLVLLTAVHDKSGGLGASRKIGYRIRGPIEVDHNIRPLKIDP